MNPPQPPLLQHTRFRMTKDAEKKSEIAKHEDVAARHVHDLTTASTVAQAAQVGSDAPPLPTVTTEGSTNSEIETPWSSQSNPREGGPPSGTTAGTLSPSHAVSTALPDRHSTCYLLFPNYQPRPLRLPVDIDSLLLVVGALVVPNPKGFIVTDETLVGGHSLWRYLVRLFGSSCLGRSEANESGTWRSLTRALSQWGEKKAERLDALLGPIRWERECRSSEYFMRVPRGSSGGPLSVRGTFIVGVSLKDPMRDPTFYPQFQAAVASVAPGLSPAQFAVVVEEYLSTVWMSHEPLDIQRPICVHNRLTGPHGGRRRNLWRTAAAEEALAKKEENPFQALVKAVAQVRGDSGLLHPHYQPRGPPTPQVAMGEGENVEGWVEGEGGLGGKAGKGGKKGKREGGRGTGVDVEAFLRVLVAVTETDPDGYVVTDAQQAGGHSIWTFILKLLGPPCLGLKPLTEANTWFAVAKGMTRMKEVDEAGLRALKQGREWRRECTVRIHPMRVPRRGRAGLGLGGSGGEIARMGGGGEKEEGEGGRSTEDAGSQSASGKNGVGQALAPGRPSSSLPFTSPPSLPRDPDSDPSTHPLPPTTTAAASSTCESSFAVADVRKVRGTFLTGITLRPPGPELEAALADAIQRIAPTFPRDRYQEAMNAYRTLWESHEALPLSHLLPSSHHKLAASRTFDPSKPGDAGLSGHGGGEAHLTDADATGCFSGPNGRGKKASGGGRKRKLPSDAEAVRVGGKKGEKRGGEHARASVTTQNGKSSLDAQLVFIPAASTTPSSLGDPPAIHPLIMRADDVGRQGAEEIVPHVLPAVNLGPMSSMNGGGSPMPTAGRYLENSVLVEM